MIGGSLNDCQINLLILLYISDWLTMDFQNGGFLTKNGKVSEKKFKNSKIYFLQSLGPMVLHIWSKFHVSSLIFEGEDLF